MVQPLSDCTPDGGDGGAFPVTQSPRGSILQPDLVQTLAKRLQRGLREGRALRAALVKSWDARSGRAFAAEAQEAPRVSTKNARTAARRRTRITGSFPRGGSPAAFMTAEP